MARNNCEVVYGPPGTGKTEYLMGAIRKLNPRETGFLSYTKTAAKEGETRAPQKLLFASTIHSLAFRIGGFDRAQVIGPDFYRALSDETGVPISKFGPQNRDFIDSPELGDEYINIINVAQNKKINLPEFYRNFTQRPGNFDSFRMFFNVYWKLKKASGMIDFNDMILRVEAQSIRSELIKLKHLIVDEAQDLSNLQWDFIKAIIENCELHRIIIAGDDDQSIFKWSGAEPHGMDEFYKYACQTMKGWEIGITKLSLCYRFGPNIHAKANEIVSTISNRVAKRYHHLEIEDMVQRRGDGIYCFYRIMYAYSECSVAILYRNHSIRKHIEAQLITDKIYFKVPPGSFPGPMNTALGKAVSALARISEDPDQTLSANERYCIEDNLLPRYKGLGLEGIITAHKQNWHIVSKLLNIPAHLMIYYDSYYHGAPTLELSTIHKAKGKEWDVVILINGMGDYTWRESMMDKDSEARVWYVAVTRARKSLNIVDWDLPYL